MKWLTKVDVLQWYKNCLCLLQYFIPLVIISGAYIRWPRLHLSHIDVLQIILKRMSGYSFTLIFLKWLNMVIDLQQNPEIWLSLLFSKTVAKWCFSFCRAAARLFSFCRINVPLHWKSPLARDRNYLNNKNAVDGASEIDQFFTQAPLNTHKLPAPDTF